MLKLEPHRSLGLDIMRGCAVLLVLFRHLPIIPENSVIQALIRGGWVGVDLFFVLSGFLVSGLVYKEYLRTQKVNILRFLIRRGFKIYPSFYFILFLLTYFSAQYKEVSTQRFMCEALFLSNYCVSVLGGTWSLAVEEHFYILFALLVLLLLHYGRKSDNPFSVIPKLYIVIAISCLTLRILTTPNALPVNYGTDLFPTHLRIDSLAMGTAIAYFYHFHRSRFLAFSQRYKYWLFGLGILLILPPFIWRMETSEYMITAGLLEFQIGGGMILIAMVSFDIPANLFSRALALIGLCSYPIYLWNFAFRQMFAANNWIYFFVNLAFGIFLGLAFEGPILKIRDRLVPARIPPKAEGFPPSSAAALQPDPK